LVEEIYTYQHSVYKCDICGFWHIGRYKQEKIKLPRGPAKFVEVRPGGSWNG